MNASEDIKELAAALAKAQGRMDGAKKDSTNPHLKRKYADLASVWDACRVALSENGLSVTQLPSGGPETVSVTTRLMHTSGQWIESELTLKPTQETPQGLGSAITYARRYALMAIVGVCADDDDGAAASTGVAGQRRQPENVVTMTPDASTMARRNELIRHIGKLVTDYSMTPEQTQAITGIKTLRNSDLTVGDLEAALKRLQTYGADNGLGVAMAKKI